MYMYSFSVLHFQLKNRFLLTINSNFEKHSYTNHKTFETQEENCKSAYWGIVTFSKDPSTSEVTVDWNGKLSKLGSFACGDAVKVGPDFLISCGTEQKWGICSAATPDIQRCDLLSCTVGTEQEADYEKWIRYFHAYSRSNCIFC